MPFLARELENPSLRKYAHVADDVTGVLVTKVSPHSAVALKADDVLVAIDGKGVGNDGSVELRRSELVDHHCLLTCKPAGEETSLLVWRAGQRLELKAVLRPLPHVLPRTNGFDCSAEYAPARPCALAISRIACTHATYDLSRMHA